MAPHGQRRGWLKNGNPPGDLLLDLQVVLPRADTPRSRAFYENMARELAFDPRRESCVESAVHARASDDRARPQSCRDVRALASSSASPSPALPLPSTQPVPRLSVYKESHR